MNPDRWHQITELFHAALSREGADRETFLQRSCREDPALRGDVDAMLAARENAASFGDRPVVAAVSGPFLCLPAGTRLANFRVESLIGVGGMGEVYRAIDTELGRSVAIKILPATLAADPDRLARLEREARVLAALNHPHIAAIFGTVQVPSDGTPLSRGLVLELIEGDTLASRLARRRRPGSRDVVPVVEALDIARQIAEALEAAHDTGIIHRDLKPENVALTHGGTVKVLDFGLAKFVNPDRGDPSLSAGPTDSHQALVMGTAAYMSPEQARGAAVDQRTDIWAFGCVLYEMLSGRQAFGGATVTETLMAVLEREPDWDALPVGTPEHVERLLRRMLQKNAALRLRDIRDARLDLVFPADAHHHADRLRHQSVPGHSKHGWRAVLTMPLVWAGLTAGAVLTGWSVRPWFVQETRDSVRYTHVVPGGGAQRPDVAVSPDGRTFVYVADQRLYVKTAGELEGRPIAGSDRRPIKPFFSFDGGWVGFFSVNTGRLEKIAVGGGTPIDVAAAAAPFGAEWGSDNTILFGQRTGIMRVSATGGEPGLLIPSDGTEIISAPQWLPNGTHVLFSRLGAGQAWSEGQIVVQSLPSGERKVLFAGASHARYVPTGHLVYAVGETLFGIGFDLARLEVRGEPVVLVQDLSRDGNAIDGMARYGISVEGTLVYARHQPPSAVPVWVGRDGREHGAPMAPPLLRPGNPRLSPDGKQLALVIDRRLWVYDLTGRPPLKLTADDAQSPVWTPDGQRLLYEGGTAAAIQLLVVRADGSGSSERLAEGHFHPHSLSADGRDLLASRLRTPSTGDDLVRLTFGPTSPVVTAVVQTPAHEGYSAALSPDRRWLSYTSNRTGQSEIWVQPYPGPGAAVRVSAGGGVEPVWSRNGRELFYLERRRLMAIAVRGSGGKFDFSPAVALFESRYARSAQPPSYDVGRDSRFVMMRSVEDTSSPASVVVIHNWFTELQRLVRQKNGPAP